MSNEHTLQYVSIYIYKCVYVSSISFMVGRDKNEDCSAGLLCNTLFAFPNVLPPIDRSIRIFNGVFGHVPPYPVRSVGLVWVWSRFLSSLIDELSNLI